MTNINHHPCKGYDAAVGDITIKLEACANKHGKTFEDVLDWVTFHRDDLMHQRIEYIAAKYDHIVDEVLERIKLMHDDWVE